MGNHAIIQSNSFHFDNDEKKMVVSVSNYKFTWVEFFVPISLFRSLALDSEIQKDRNSFTLQFNRQSFETTTKVTTTTIEKTQV